MHMANSGVFVAPTTNTPLWWYYSIVQPNTVLYNPSNDNTALYDPSDGNTALYTPSDGNAVLYNPSDGTALYTQSWKSCF